MKRVLVASVALIALAVSASAADVRVRRTPPPAPGAAVLAPFYNWTGFYVGGHLGWGDSTLDTNGSSDGFLGGVQAGYNFQMNQLVFGVEGQISWTDIGNDTNLGAVATSIDWLATIAGRLGYAFGPALAYGKVGVAFLDWTSSAGRGLGTGDTETGWVLGAGLEYGFTPNWSAKIEYNFTSFELDRTSLVRSTFDRELDVHLVKLGINYRFGWPAAPVTRRY
jgi:outer membrane immunogenic protein